MTSPPATPPTQPPAPPYGAITVFGWLVFGVGAALLYVERVGLSPWTLGGGIFIMLMGGWCINRDPLVSFGQAITAGITAWRGKRDS